jgi:hypothetical protein
MTIEDMTVLMHWSENVCPHEMFEHMPEETSSTLKLLTEHGMMRAFASCGFTLWTR